MLRRVAREAPAKRALVTILALILLAAPAGAEPALDGEAVTRLINERLLARAGANARPAHLVTDCAVHEDARFANGQRRLLAACRLVPIVRHRPEQAVGNRDGAAAYVLTVSPLARGWQLVRFAPAARVRPLTPA